MKEKINVFCEACEVFGPTKYVEFYKNIGLLIMRNQESIKGYLCKNCISYFFWRFTLITLIAGWWGVISFFATPIFIINNTIRYLTSLRLKSPEELGLRPRKKEITTQLDKKIKANYCSNCGKQINEEVKFCGYCGTEIITKGETSSTEGKNCPFCKKEIGFGYEKCPNCKRILVEKIPTNEKYTADTSKFKNQTKESIVSKFIGLGRRINYSKLIFNKYIAILFGVIFVVWILSGDDSSYNSGGTKAPLPPPVKQISDDSVEFTPLTPAVSLANGTILKKNSVYLRGDGELQIKNGTGLDAVAKLIRGGTSVLTVYIKANSTYTMPDISDDIYWLAFAQGLDWDSATQKFRRNTQYSVFEDTFDFTTTNSQYTIFEVTLNPVLGGTAQTTDVDPQQFDAY